MPDAKVVITADISIRRGKAIQLKAIVDEAIINAPTVEHVDRPSRRDPPVDLHELELDFYEMMKGMSDVCEPEVMDAEDPFFILYTSGSTENRRGLSTPAGGIWSGPITPVNTSSISRTTISTGALPIRVGSPATVISCMVRWRRGNRFHLELTPDYPDAGSYWHLIEEQKITIFYTAPTAIRMFMKMGEIWPNKYDLSSLRIIGSVGEPLNPEAFEWYYRVIGKRKCPILDTWWQTETGMHMITTMIGEPMRPGFAGKPIPGIEADVVDKDGNSGQARHRRAARNQITVAGHDADGLQGR
jgi:acetyl-CoA synthetase